MSPKPKQPKLFREEIKTVSLLGEEISEEHYPILMRRARQDLKHYGNLDYMEKWVQSVADAWHEGSVASALQALESDLGTSSGGG